LVVVNGELERAWGEFRGFCVPDEGI